MNTTCNLASRLEVPYATTVNHFLRFTMQYEVPDTVDSIMFATEGNVEGLKLLFTHGFAFPSDDLIIIGSRTKTINRSIKLFCTFLRKTLRPSLKKTRTLFTSKMPKAEPHWIGPLHAFN
ncbi:uncharacterized protein PgNI_02225 [Pyricularia grisea]|uniref:Uncharacterized protein n=1 Tax=Pyricularia grisea TaxID=148305 RepID=A0A6P8BHG6_PYRGI|nr:uncharacterized protein PgNI_02225 [Pyricularia grisea]TLD16054.1 hypothetical protein PgNI_02225 [Pyricularia grisea]